MRRAAGTVAALVLGAAAVAGLILLLQERDDSTIAQPAPAPGERRSAELPLALERAVQLGNVVLLHRAPRPPRPYGRPSPELRAAGQAVIPHRVAVLPHPVVAVAARRQQAGARPADVAEFVEHWLGRR